MSFLLSVAAFAVPLNIQLQADANTSEKLVFLLIGIAGLAGCIVFAAVCRCLLDHAEVLAATNDDPADADNT